MPGRVRQRLMASRLRSRPFAIGFAALAVGLAGLHGWEGSWFRVDEVTLGLMVLAGLPVLAMYVETFKGGGVELRFRSLGEAQQLAVFLEAVASRSAWTFYEPRPGESHLGQAFRVLVEELRENDPEAFEAMVERFMASEDVNLRYFAAEVIGCFRIKPLRRLLQKGLGDTDPDARWPLWRLNCLWADSRFEEYRPLHRFLMETRDDGNQDWLLDIYRQMPAAGEASAAEFAKQLRLFLERTDLVEGIKGEALRIVTGLEAGAAPAPGAPQVPASRQVVPLVSPKP